MTHGASPGARVRARAALLGMALALGACAELPERRPSEGALFEVSGRLAIRLEQEAVSGGFTWLHRDDSDSIVLRGPLGQGVASLERQPGQAVLTRADGERFSDADAEGLMQQVLGWSLPVSGLAHWIVGSAAPGPALIERDAAGRLTRLEQDGWAIAIQPAEPPARDDLPARLDLVREGVRVRIAIEEWLVAPEPRR